MHLSSSECLFKLPQLQKVSQTLPTSSRILYGTIGYVFDMIARKFNSQKCKLGCNRQSDFRLSMNDPCFEKNLPYQISNDKPASLAPEYLH